MQNLQHMYDGQPYPLIPIEVPVRDQWKDLFKVHLTTAQYVRTHALVNATQTRGQPIEPYACS